MACGCAPTSKTPSALAWNAAVRARASGKRAGGAVGLVALRRDHRRWAAILSARLFARLFSVLEIHDSLGIRLRARSCVCGVEPLNVKGAPRTFASD